LKRGVLFVLVVLGCAWAAGCQEPASAPAHAPASGPAKAAADATTYYCDDGRTVRARYHAPGAATVSVDGEAHAMKTAISASGARYVGDGLQWWTRDLGRGALSGLKPGEDIASGAGVNCSTIDTEVMPPEPGTPGGLPDDRTPTSEAPFTATSAQGAADVVQLYFALIGEGKYGEAWEKWTDGGRASGQTREAFRAGFGRYRSYRALVGAPGEVEGAAGSLYVNVPVVIYGRMADGPELHLRGVATLRRVNDVPGSTAGQRLWRIAKIELTPP